MIMIKKFFHYLVFFVLFIVLHIARPAFAEFTVTVINESGIEYEDVALVITAVGFNAMYGRISLGEIGPEPTPRDFTFGNKYLQVPLTGLPMPSPLTGCNLNMTVIASPKQISYPITTHIFESIITTYPQIIEEEGKQKYPSRPRMKGIQPPRIRIIIGNDIEAKFD